MNTLIPDRKKLSTEFARYALPAVVGMVISSVYVIVDGMFVGRMIGDMALGGINIVFPFVMLQIAITMLIATGGSNVISFYRGRVMKEEANNVFNQCVGMLAIAGLVLCLVPLFFNEQLCRLLGADEQLLPYSMEYLRYMAFFIPVQTVGMGFGMFLRNDGSPTLAMAATLVGSISNIALDYLFIGPLGMGIAGAAIATGIGIILEFCTCLLHFARRKGMLRLRLPRFQAQEVRKVLFNGIPSFLMEFCQSAVVFSFNIVIARYMGAEGIAAYSIVMYICSIFNMVLIGIVHGAQPLISFNHGSGEIENVCFLHKLGSLCCLAATGLFMGLCLLGGRLLISLFIDDNDMVASMAANMMRFYMLGYFPVGLTMMNILYLQATERELYSGIVSVLRCVGFIQLFLLVLPSLMGVHGIFLSYLIGEGCNLLVSAGLYRKAAKVYTVNNLRLNAQEFGAVSSK